MKQRFEVTFSETVTYVVRVEAHSADDAAELAEAEFSLGDPAQYLQDSGGLELKAVDPG